MKWYASYKIILFLLTRTAVIRSAAINYKILFFFLDCAKIELK